ncbi:MAG: HRDC domain-containing protein [Desulfobacteraceae bacterium]|jgi:ribonuclease D
MTRKSKPAYQTISSSVELEEFVTSISHVKQIAVDLEADSMFHFKEKVCLLQMAANRHNVVIDPLAIRDLSPLRPLLESSKIRKIFHGADYDIRSLYRDFKIEVNNLFDTQLASMFLGIRETSLEALLASNFDISLNKKYQKKDWSQRPLPKEMETYAAGDVSHLIPLAKIIISELRSRKRLSWVKEECDLLSNVRPTKERKTPLFLKFKGAGRLAPRNLAILEKLLKYRRNMAHKKDKPLFKILANASILKIATNPPKNLNELKQLNALSPRQMTMYGKGIVSNVGKAMKLDTTNLPRYPRKKAPILKPVVPERIKSLRLWRDQEAEKLGLEPALLLNKTLLTMLAVKKPTTIKKLDTVESLRRWQKREFGRKIISVLKEIP